MATAIGHHGEDPDERLLRELRGPCALDEAREALAFWQQRHERLPARRLKARREARAMMDTWRVRVREAELAALGDGPLARLRAALLRPRPRIGRFIERALIAATLTSIALCALAVAALNAIFG